MISIYSKFHEVNECVLQLSWDASRSSCSCDNAAELASIDTVDVNTLVSDLSGTVEKTWIGGSDAAIEDTWTWTDGTAWSYTNWKSGQPNNGGTDGQNCLSMNTDGTWDDVDCTTLRQYVCTKPDSDQAPLTSNPACSCEAGWTASLHTGK